ncbi:MAG: hypothetical protein VKM17_00420 [Cyanobacteriota bacterium]|nr:hypothetical protein [Cyanobacteriota bacterium]
MGPAQPASAAARPAPGEDLRMAPAIALHPCSRRQLLHLAADLAALVENPSDLPHGFDLLTRSYATPAAEAARAALRYHPAIAPLVRERYWLRQGSTTGPRGRQQPPGS